MSEVPSPRIDLHHARLQARNIADEWRNLNQTVPPHAQDWWDRNMATGRLRASELAGTLDHFDEERWQSQGAELEQELVELEKALFEAKEELGSRTAAGRARS